MRSVVDIVWYRFPGGGGHSHLERARGGGGGGYSLCKAIRGCAALVDHFF